MTLPRILLASAAALALAAPTLAQADPAPAAPRPNRVVLDPQTIHGRAPRPLAAVEVNQVTRTIPLSDLHPDFTKKIASATGRDPF